ncbi:AdoMet-dependent rRNA methyltransferase spb1 [Linum grandiflorum]
MGKDRKVKRKRRFDEYRHLAKEHGYRSRASWKLVQIDSKFKLLHSSHAVLDLCAAPGGWMQVAVEKVPAGSVVLGIDLKRIAPLRGALSIEQDITESECKSKIEKIMEDHEVKAFDLVLHDGRPKVGDDWSEEARSQNALVIGAVKLATQFLAPNGNFVTKVFRSQDYHLVIYCLSQLFENVEVEKPLASRKESAEIYVLGLKYKAPAEIDPRLLDFELLLQASVDPPRTQPVVPPRVEPRCEDRRSMTAAEFVWSLTPLDVLGSATSFTFDDPVSLRIKDHELTTEEVKALCDDLSEIGRQGFKHLLKWRVNLRKALSPSEKASSAAAEAAVSEEKKEVDDAVERKKKRRKKIMRS